jgi:hypothetical protein
MASISSLLKRPLSFVMVILSEIPFPFSTALTDNILFSSISKVTSIYGYPLGASGIPVKSNFPKL